MSSPGTSRPLVFKPKLHIPWGWFLVLGAMLFKWWAHVAAHPERQLAYTAILVAVCLLALLWVIFLYWPGQGQLSLTPSGFSVNALWWPYRVNYRWTQVQGFYMDTYHSNHQEQWQVFIQLADNTPGQKRQRLHYRYDIEANDLSDLLNEWKLRYAPPVTVTAPTQAERTAEAKANMWRNINGLLLVIGGILLLTGLVVGGYLLFHDAR